MQKPLFVRLERILLKLNPHEVAYLETDKNYTRICFPDKTCYMVRSTLSATLKKFPPGLFIQTDRAHAVSLLHVAEIGKTHVAVAETAIPITKQNYEELLKQLEIIG